MTTTLIGGISLGIWVYLLLARGRFWRMSRATPVLSRDHSAPSVTAVVPARNEAEVVGRAMESLAAQAYAGEFHIVLVDDGARTARHEWREPRLRTWKCWRRDHCRPVGEARCGPWRKGLPRRAASICF